MKIRRIAAEERLATTYPLQAYAFSRTISSERIAEEFRPMMPYHRGNVSLIAEEGGTTLAAVTAIPMRQNVRGRVFAMAGIAGVVSHPLARRQGNVRALLTQLLGELRDEGQVVSTLYPFRASFYERFGYVGLPKPRTVRFAPAGLAPLLRADLPGEVGWQRIRDGYPEYDAFCQSLLTERHGFSLFPDYRAVRLRDEDERWLVTARVDGTVVGAVTYRIEGHGQDLVADDLLTANPLGRALLLRFFAGHVDQVARVVATVATDETPELWSSDLAVETLSRISFPDSVAPMARVLSMTALAGIDVGPGRVAVEIVDDPFLAGCFLLDGGDGQLDVGAGSGVNVADRPVPAATLTTAGLSALVYGVLDPAEVVLRGLGTIPEEAAAQLRILFPRRIPYLFSDF